MSKITNLILDCETIDLKYNFICDLSWAIVSKNKIIAVKNYIVQENLDRMATGSFSGAKMSATMAEVKNGNAEIKSYSEICAELASDLEMANYVYAYNASFDRGKIIATAKSLQLPEWAEHFEKIENFDKWRCLWAWATNTILYKKSFIDWCEVNGQISEKGNCKTSAETTLKFIMNDLDYVEQHTARADVLDEFIIYLACKNMVKKEFGDRVLDDRNFKGTWHNIAKLKKAFNS